MSFLIENQCRVLFTSTSDLEATEMNLDTGMWKAPIDIDDADLTFHGKPLNIRIFLLCNVLRGL